MTYAQTMTLDEKLAIGCKAAELWKERRRDVSRKNITERHLESHVKFLP